MSRALWFVVGVPLVLLMVIGGTWIWLEKREAAIANRPVDLSKSIETMKTADWPTRVEAWRDKLPPKSDTTNPFVEAGKQWDAARSDPVIRAAVLSFRPTLDRLNEPPTFGEEELIELVTEWNAANSYHFEQLTPGDEGLLLTFAVVRSAEPLATLDAATDEQLLNSDFGVDYRTGLLMERDLDRLSLTAGLTFLFRLSALRAAADGDWETVTRRLRQLSMLADAAGRSAYGFAELNTRGNFNWRGTQILHDVLPLLSTEAMADPKVLANLDALDEMLADDASLIDEAKRAFEAEAVAMLQLAESIAAASPEQRREMVENYSADALETQTAVVIEGCNRAARAVESLSVDDAMNVLDHAGLLAAAGEDTGQTADLLNTAMRTVERVYLDRAGRRLARVALALHRYRIDHDNTLPATLDDLVPTYLEVVPIDPMSRDRLAIQYDPVRRRIWSASLNRADDGGATPGEVHPSSAFDLVEPLDGWWSPGAEAKKDEE